jgi:hypothetical protein
VVTKMPGPYDRPDREQGAVLYGEDADERGGGSGSLRIGQGTSGSGVDSLAGLEADGKSGRRRVASREELRGVVEEGFRGWRKAARLGYRATVS